MKYVRRVDELLAAPPYWLGMDNQGFRFEAHRFTVPANTAKLNQILDDHLNPPATSPPATDENGAKLPLHYSTASSNVLLSFVRYWRAQSDSEPGKGWMAYTETLISFYVTRKAVDSDHPSEVFLYVATVNIDDSYYTGQQKDPASMAILLGRESYGLPKNPGQIFYRPTIHDPNGAKLQVWDPRPDARFVLKDAIVVDPDMPEYARVDPQEVTVLPPEVSAAEPDDPARWGILASQLGLRPEALVNRLRKPPRSVRLSDKARLLTMPDAWGEMEAVVWDDLLFHAQLVGLKQFPDPTTPYTSGQPMGACYQAIVETPLEEHPLHKLPPPNSSSDDHEILFPPLNRVDLISTFGLEDPDGDRKIHIGVDRIAYQHGRYYFARPQRTKVWTLG